MPWVYILRCSDKSLYVGMTTDLVLRFKQHQDGAGGSYTSKRRPVELVYTEELPKIADAISREVQLKRWSAKKKRALIVGNVDRLHALAKRRRPKTR